MWHQCVGDAFWTISNLKLFVVNTRDELACVFYFDKCFVTFYLTLCISPSVCCYMCCKSSVLATEQMSWLLTAETQCIGLQCLHVYLFWSNCITMFVYSWNVVKWIYFLEISTNFHSHCFPLVVRVLIKSCTAEVLQLCLIKFYCTVLEVLDFLHWLQNLFCVASVFQLSHLLYYFKGKNISHHLLLVSSNNFSTSQYEFILADCWTQLWGWTLLCSCRNHPY